MDNLDIIHYITSYLNDIDKYIVKHVNIAFYNSIQESILLNRYIYKHNINVFEWCINSSNTPNDNMKRKILLDIAIIGDIDKLKLVTKKYNYYLFDETKQCARAAKYGRIEYLKYLHEHGYKWNKMTCDFAAICGQLECLKYAHENGCPWNEDVCYLATWMGNLECLKYAHENGCPWNDNTFKIAITNGHDKCVMYMINNGFIPSE